LVARTRVARTRLTPEEYDSFVAQAKEAGVNPGEYLRNLIVGHKAELKSIVGRVSSLELRLTHVESEIAKAWVQWGET
jgi:hypothetical protein